MLLETVVWLDLLIRYCRASPLSLLFSSALVSTAYSQEHLKTITFAKIWVQTECNYGEFEKLPLFNKTKMEFGWRRVQKFV